MKVRALGLCFALAVTACGGSPQPVDAGSDADIDAYTYPPSALFRACVEDSQCPGPGGFCRTADEGYPGGYCTLACEDRTVCDDGAVYNHCLDTADRTERVCEARCRNGEECRRTYSCSIFEGANEGVCVPVCARDEDCGGTAQCNVYSGRCVPAGTLPTGATTGQACADDSDCISGSCRPEVAGLGTPTGYVDGYCDGPCRLPAGYNTSDFFTGDFLPVGSCSGASICYPAGDLGEGDLGTCLAECFDDSECRGGYQCLSLIQGHQFMNGVCLPPTDCRSPRCPTGYVCTQVGATEWRCGPE